jgi:hypothetical protein
MSEPRRILLGTYASVDQLVIPAPILERADAALAVERKQREREAERARLTTMQQARARSKLRRALAGCLGGRWK